MAPSQKRFELWFPFTPGVIGVAEDELAAVHNRPFVEVLSAIGEVGDWQIEQCYFTDKSQSYAAPKT